MRRLALPLVSLVLALLLLLPLRLVLGGSGLAAGTVTGTAWSGALSAAQWHGLSLGDLAVRLRLPGLARGRLAFAVAGTALSGDLWQSASGAGATDLAGSIPLAGAIDLPLASLTVSAVSLDWQDGCRLASGSVRVLPTGALARLGPLSGSPRCENGRLVLPLASADGRATLQLSLDGQRWQGRLTVATGDEGERMALLAAGFQPGPAGPVLITEGRL